jgi:sugar lactone lactonase YvrE
MLRPCAVVVSVVMLSTSGCSSSNPATNSAQSPSTAASVATPVPTTVGVASTAEVSDLIAPGAKVELVAEGLKFAEGPVWLPDGRLIVSDVGGDAVVAIDKAGSNSDFRRPSNVANGHALDRSGSVVEAEAGDGTNHGMIAEIAADGSATVLADNFDGKHFNAPNDLTVKSDGTIWFTDPDFNQQFTSEIGFNGVYRLDPTTKAVTLVTKALQDPNGIAFSNDENTLYVTDSADNYLASYPVAADGTVGPEKILGRGCDGIGVDEQATYGHQHATTTTSSSRTRPVSRSVPSRSRESRPTWRGEVLTAGRCSSQRKPVACTAWL